MRKVDYARNFSIKAHQHQVYGDFFPYSMHIEMVWAEYLRMTKTAGDVNAFLLYLTPEQLHDLECVLWLHDVLEDTGITYNDIAKLFGTEIADSVFNLSDGLGRNRKERKAIMYLNIKDDVVAKVAKVIDRLANIRFCKDMGGKLDMYTNEHSGFVTGIAIHNNEHEIFHWLRVELEKILGLTKEE